MREHAIFDKIDLHRIRVLHTVLTERSVSRAARMLFADARGLDEHPERQGLQRIIAARVARFSLIPAIVASTLLVLTTGRACCEGFVGRLPVNIFTCPISFPRMRYYQRWQARSKTSAAGKWLRERIRAMAADLPQAHGSG